MRQTQNRTILPQAIPSSAILQNVSSHLSVPPSVAHFPAGLAHDARNVIAAMDIYCELLSGPGVLNPQYLHLADELRLLRESASGLMDRLLILAIRSDHRDPQPTSFHDSDSSDFAAAAVFATPSATDESTFVEERSTRKPVADVALELLASHRMLSALAGPKVQVELATVEAPGGALMIASVDFTRVLINLVRNAAEAMGTGGRILISARAANPEALAGPAVLVSVEDNGPGIPLSLLERIFDLNSAADPGEHQRRRMSFRPRGLGLRIVRELVEGGGGVIRAARLPERGSCFEIVLPFVT